MMLLFFLATRVNAQDLPLDSSVREEAKQAAIARYHSDRGIASAIFNGIQHFGYAASIQGHAYQGTDEWQKGSVVYEGILYTGLLLKYDLIADQLLVQHPSGFGVALFSPRVQSFQMQDQEFIYLPQDSLRSFMPAGFYRWLAKGKLSILERSSKWIDEYEDGLKMSKRILESDQFFALKDGLYYPIKKKTDFYTLVADKRREVIRYMKQNKLNFKRAREQALMQAAIFYNQ